jgi:rhodanese-related sulfurtransferase
MHVVMLEEDISKLLGNQDLIIIDVRTESEFEAGHLSGAINIDIRQEGFNQRLRQYSLGYMVLVYCKGGSRALAAAQQLKKLDPKMEVYVSLLGFNKLSQITR